MFKFMFNNWISLTDNYGMATVIFDYKLNPQAFAVPEATSCPTCNRRGDRIGGDCHFTEGIEATCPAFEDPKVLGKYANYPISELAKMDAEYAEWEADYHNMSHPIIN